MRVRSIVAVVAVVGATLVAQTPPSAVANPPTPPPITGTALPTPAGGTNVVTTAISCPGAGSCVAVGNYVASTTTEGVIETLSGGSWTAAPAPLPLGATTTPAVTLDHVACGAVGSCVAYGTYEGTDAKQHFVLLSLASGTWTPQELDLVLPAGADATKTVSLHGVACSAANSCAVVGDYVGTDLLGHSFAAMFHGGWSAVKVTLPADAEDTGSASGALSNLEGVSCSASLCIAVGKYVVTNGTSRGLAASIDPVAGTVNATQAPMGSNIMGFGDLNSISCAASGPCAAYGSYDDTGSTFHYEFVPLGGASWSAIDVPTLTPATSHPIVVGLGCVSSTSGADCVAGGVYSDPSTQFLVDRLTSNSWGAVNGSFPGAVLSFACGSSSFCVGISNNSPHNAVTAFSGGAWTVQDAPNPGTGAFPPTANGIFGVSCDSSTSCWIIGTTTGTVTGGLAEHVGTSVAPPTISLTGPTSPFTLSSSTKVTWTASSAAGLAGFQVRYRKAAWNGGFGGWQVGWPSVAGSARSLTASGLARGTDYCYEARAEDTLSTWSGWTAQRCTAVPLDDRSLSTSKHWTRAKGSAYWNGTVTSTKTVNATMSRTSAQLDRLAIVATRCSSCGKIKVYVGSTLIGTVNLAAAHTARRVVILLPAFSLRSGTVKIKVITSGKSVQIDGVGMSRT